MLSTKPAAVRKRRERERGGRKPCMVDIGDDVFSTLQYLNWVDTDEPDNMRDLLTRALSDWAKLRNPWLV